MDIIYTFILSFLLLGPVPSAHAMDGGQEPEAPKSALEQLPSETFMHILNLVIQHNPNALGNLITIQQVCRQFAQVLSKQEMKWILGLNQEELNWRLATAIWEGDPNNIQVLINLGAKFNKEEIISDAIDFFMDKSINSNYTLEKLTAILHVLENAGATWPVNANQLK